MKLIDFDEFFDDYRWTWLLLELIIVEIAHWSILHSFIYYELLMSYRYIYWLKWSFSSVINSRSQTRPARPSRGWPCRLPPAWPARGRRRTQAGRSRRIGRTPSDVPSLACAIRRISFPSRSTRTLVARVRLAWTRRRLDRLEQKISQYVK